MTFGQVWNKTVKVAKVAMKHKPAVLAGVGVLSIGALTYSSYKGRYHIENLTDRLVIALDCNEELEKRIIELERKK